VLSKGAIFESVKTLFSMLLNRTVLSRFETNLNEENMKSLCKPLFVYCKTVKYTIIRSRQVEDKLHIIVKQVLVLLINFFVHSFSEAEIIFGIKISKRKNNN